MSDRFLQVLPDLPPFGPEVLGRLAVQGLHCACGQQLRANWLNVDAMPLSSAGRPIPSYGRITRIGAKRYYLQADLTQALPFDDGTFAWVYAEHFIEHLIPQAAIAWLQEVRRVLRPGGLLRITTPDLRKYVDGYQEESGGFFAQRREHLESLRMGQVPLRKAWLFNNIFYGWEHRWIYDFEELQYAGLQAGFPEGGIRECSFRQGSVRDVFDLDLPERSHESLYAEITLPDG